MDSKETKELPTEPPPTEEASSAETKEAAGLEELVVEPTYEPAPLPPRILRLDDSDPCSDNCYKNLPEWNFALEEIVCELNKSAKFKQQFSLLVSSDDRVRLCLQNDALQECINGHLMTYRFLASVPEEDCGGG